MTWVIILIGRGALKLSGTDRFFLYIFIILLSAGCATRDRGADYVSEITRKEYNQDYFRRLIQDRNYQSAFIDYYSLFPQGREGEEWEMIREDLTGGMIGEFQKALEGEQFLKALSLYNSLERTGNIDSLAKDREELNYDYLAYMMDKKYSGAAACWFLKNRHSMSLGNEEMERLEKFFLQGRLSTPLAALAGLKAEQGSELGEESALFSLRNLRRRICSTVRLLSGLTAVSAWKTASAIPTG